MKTEGVSGSLQQTGFGSVRFGLALSGLVRFESVRFGSVRFGSVRFGSVRFGSVRFGSIMSVRFGSIMLGWGPIGVSRGSVGAGWSLRSGAQGTSATPPRATKIS